MNNENILNILYFQKYGVKILPPCIQKNSNQKKSHIQIFTSQYTYLIPLGENIYFGNENLFGINSATIPGILIGNRNKIAAGMVLDQNVGDESVVFYRYKEKVIAYPKSEYIQ